MKLKRARLADDLNEKIALRPGPMELVEKNILPVDPASEEVLRGRYLWILLKCSFPQSTTKVNQSSFKWRLRCTRLCLVPAPQAIKSTTPSRQQRLTFTASMKTAVTPYHHSSLLASTRPAPSPPLPESLEGMLPLKWTLPCRYIFYKACSVCVSPD